MNKQMELEMRKVQKIARTMGMVDNKSTTLNNQQEEQARKEKTKISKKVQMECRKKAKAQMIGGAKDEGKKNQEKKTGRGRSKKDEELDSLRTDSDKEADEEHEITKILKYREKRDGKGYLTFQWNSGRTEEADMELVIVDAFKEVLVYIKDEIKRRAGNRQGLQKLRNLVEYVVKKAKGKKEKSSIKDLKRDWEKHLTSQGTMETMCTKTVNESKDPAQARKGLCDHSKLTDLQQESNAANCGKGYKLYNKRCNLCHVTMIEKGKSKKGELFRPSTVISAYMCKNIEKCEYVLCGSCYGDELVRTAGRSGRQRTRKG